MTWLQRIRPVLYLLGVLLVVGSLLGARLLTHGSGGGTEPTPKTANPTNGKNGSGPIVTGYVYTDRPLITYGLPPVLQSGRITKMSVSEGQEVKQGETLYVFDTRVQEANLKNAQVGVKQAEIAVQLAKSQLVDQYPKQLAIKRQIVETANTQVGLTQRGYEVYEGNLKVTLDQKWGTDRNSPKWQEQYSIEPTLYDLDTKRKKAIDDRNTAQASLEAAEAAKKDLELQVDKAQAAVQQAQVLVEQAQVVLDQCAIKADTDGVVERVTVSEGATLMMGPQPPSAVTLIPAGKRVVRAEVEAEFAHRIGPDKKGKEVTITDHFDGKLTYKGVVRDIGTAFLQKRTSGDGFGMNDTRVLEVVVEVTDPNPRDKPSLKVGQKVRVNFGQ